MDNSTIIVLILWGATLLSGFFYLLGHYHGVTTALKGVSDVFKDLNEAITEREKHNEKVKRD